MLELFSSVHEKCPNYFQSKYLCNRDTLEVYGVVDLAFTSCSRHVLHSIRQVGGGGRLRRLSLKFGRDAAKN
jgi:hypothetical protein